MDGENNGKPYFLMDDLGVFPLFLETPISANQKPPYPWKATHKDFFKSILAFLLNPAGRFNREGALKTTVPGCPRKLGYMVIGSMG